MTFKTAREKFEELKEQASNNEDEAMQLLADGMLDLTKSLQSALRDMQSKLDTVSQRVGRLS